MKIKVLFQGPLLLNMKSFDEKILRLLICPKTGRSLSYDKKKRTLHTKDLKNIYKITDNIVILKSQ